MQNTKDERWRPTGVSSPSSRLRAARSMPPWMQARGSAVPPTVPPPPNLPPPPDPDYEVIEFTTQQAYSNAPPPRPALPGKPRGDGQRCDLCGSSAPIVVCEKCSQQNFCLSCDEMYHRHPKRQNHVRKPLETNRTPTLRPPLPPKGENTSAPVPPPRRHKRSGRSTPVSSDQFGKSSLGGVVMGSLKRMMGGRPLPPAPPMTRDSRLPVSTSPLNFTEFPDHQPPSRDSGYLDWEMDSRHRSGSFTALNAPTHGPLMHAQSMAALNCPSCHHHGLVWDWNQSHMMSGGFGPQWNGLPTGTWHGSAMLPPYRPEIDMGRRNSMRAPPRRSRRDLTTDDEDLHRRRNASPARSRRGPINDERISPARSRRGLVSDDSEDEVMSHRGGRRHRRRTSPASPALSRRSSRKKSMGVEELIARRVKQNEEEALRSGRYDDETMSNRSSRRYEDDTISNRGGRRYHDDDRLSTKSSKRQDMDDTHSIRGSKRNEYDDSMSNRSQRIDDDIISNRGGKRNDFDESVSNRGGRRLSDTNRRRRRSSPTQLKKLSRNGSSEDSGDEMSDGLKNKSTTLAKQLKNGASNYNQETNHEDINIPMDVDEPLGPIPTEEWECDHCTFVNQAGTRVCTVCCKTTNSPKYKKLPSKPQPTKQNSTETIPATSYQNSSTSPLKENIIQEHMKIQETNTTGEIKIKSAAKEQTIKPSNSYEGGLSEKMKKQLTISSAPEKKKDFEAEKVKPAKTTISTGTSPPPQSISTQTYDVLQNPRLKRAISLADPEQWNSSHRNFSSRISVASDSQSLPLTPPRARSPDCEPSPREWELRHFDSRSQSQLSRRPSEPVHTVPRFSRRSGSQPPEYLSTLVQKQVKQGMEMVKLLREAEEQQFTADDLSVALAQCGEGDPVAWLKDNWRNMIDTVVTLATNYGHERRENTIGTISAAEARDALRQHGGNVWAAVTECVDQRQKKYADLMSKGNFTREDIVTVLTANHGNLEAAYLELNKTQLKPFLMRIWGPPQGPDNESANFPLHFQQQDERLYMDGQGQGHEVEEEVSDPNFHRIKSWLDTLVHQSVETHDTKSINQQQHNVHVETDASLKLSMGSLVDKSMSNPPKIPPRRKTSKVENPIQSDYENILKLETDTQMEYFNTSIPTTDKPDMGKENDAGSTHVDAEDDTDNLEASDKVKFETQEESTTGMEELVEIPKRTNAEQRSNYLEENSTVKINENVSLNKYKEEHPRKQIIVEKLIVNGKVQEIRKYILNNDEAESFIEQTNVDSKTIYPESVFSDYVNKENITVTHTINASKITDSLYTSSFTKESETVIKGDEPILRSDDKSNSTSYESLCYSEEDEEENNDSNLNIPDKDIVTSAKLLVVMDSDVLKSLREKSISPVIIASDHNKTELHDSSTESKTNSDIDPKVENTSPTSKKSTVRVSNTSNVKIERNIPPEKVTTVKENEINELILKDMSIYDNKIESQTTMDRTTEHPNPQRELDLEEENEAESLSKRNSASVLSLESQEEFVTTFTGLNQISIPIVRAVSISPSATEIIAGSTQSSRGASPELEQFDEFREEFEEVSINNTEPYKKDEITVVNTTKSEVIYQPLTDQILLNEHLEETTLSNKNISQAKNNKKAIQPERFENDSTEIVSKESHKYLENNDKLDERNDLATDEKHMRINKVLQEKENLKNEHTYPSTKYIIKENSSYTTNLTESNNSNTIPSTTHYAANKSEHEKEDQKSYKDMGHKGLNLDSSKEIENIPKVIRSKITDVLNKEKSITETFIPDETFSIDENSSEKKSALLTKNLNNDIPTIIVVNTTDEITTKADFNTLMKLDDISKSPDIAQVTLVETPKSNLSQSLNTTPSSMNISEKASSEGSTYSSRELSPVSPMMFEQEEKQIIETGSVSFVPDIINEKNSEIESQHDFLKNYTNFNAPATISEGSESGKSDSHQRDSRQGFTPAPVPEYVMNEALNSVSIEDDKCSSLGSKSTRGSSDKSQASDRSLSMTESRAEILELLKESLSSDHVLDRIVNTLFASVLNHTDSVETGRPSDSEELLPDSDIHHFQTFSSSDSEIKTESDFYEAQDEVENEDIRGYINVIVGDDKEGEEPDLFLNKEFTVVKEQTDGISTEELNVTEYERQVRRYLAEGVVPTYDQAELVVKLMELDFDKELSISAAKECNSVQSAVTFLQQDCHLCTGKYPMNQMISMLECEHRCCRDCALHYFTLQITERSITNCVCPFCKQPDLSSANQDKALDYFSNLDIMLKDLLEETIHELFQRKLRDRTLMQDPNFKWCIKCSSGFIANPRQKRLVCPDCRSVTCANCRRPWEKQHEGMSCDEYGAWLEENNDPEIQLTKHLADHGVTCPSCNERYSLSKGGCMHLTCPHCGHEFCVGCSKPFMMGTKCQVSDYCEKLGLHAHHPRNCLFYLRDKEPELLEKLLDDNGIEYNKDTVDKEGKRCSIQLQRETPEGLTDSPCGLWVEKAGLCRTHFIEYLVKLIGQHKLDPVVIMDQTEVQQELRRRGKPLPIRASGQTDADYTALCSQIVQEEIPLE